MSDRRIFLFDVDGVLVQPGGYRQAVRATLNAFCDQMNLPALAPSDDTIALFEAEGITCEWDMLPFLLAMTLEGVHAYREDLQTGDFALSDLMGAIAQRPTPEITVNFAQQIRGLGRWTRDGEAPADTFAALFEAGEAAAVLPGLWQGARAAVREIFSHTRNPAQSLTTRWFENFALGSDTFSTWMGLPAPVISPSLLALYDQPLLAPESRAALQSVLRADAVRAAVFTARPSRPLEVQTDLLAVFAPEAEAALDLVQLNEVPLIGSGQMAAAALRLGVDSDRLTKPAFYHALAAVYAACTGDRAASLEWVGQAYRFLEDQASPPPMQWTNGDSLQITVFEDSPSGTRAVMNAGKILRELGVPTHVRCCGVTTHPEKRCALEALGASVDGSINLALKRCLEPPAPFEEA